MGLDGKSICRLDFIGKLLFPGGTEFRFNRRTFFTDVHIFILIQRPICVLNITYVIYILEGQ